MSHISTAYQILKFRRDVAKGRTAHVELPEHQERDIRTLQDHAGKYRYSCSIERLYVEGEAWVSMTCIPHVRISDQEVP